VDLEQEKALVERAKTEPEAYGEIFDQYYPVIFNYILRRTADVSLSQDIAAETFLKAYQNIGKFKWQGISVGNWFYRIATNELRMHWRKAKYTPRSLEELFDIEGFEPISNYDLQQEAIVAQTNLERQTQFAEAQKLLSTLPPKYQEAIALRFIGKKKVSEIAQILGKKEGTVKSLLSRGLKMLRSGLEPLEMQPNSDTSINVLEGKLIISAEGTYEE
jgi:RNA polymerase sigma-70 factor, ECF subfamily